MQRNRANVVFVGNIPFEVTEQELTKIFEEAGPVVSFKLVFDRDTKKAKGFGFCTYHDSETAASAVRNLNNYPLGGRTLRVATTDTDNNNNNNNQSNNYNNQSNNYNNNGPGGQGMYGGSQDPRSRGPQRMGGQQGPGGYQNQGRDGPPGSNNNNNNNNSVAAAAAAAAAASNPQGAAESMNAVEMINRNLSTISQNDCFSALVQLKTISQSNPEEVKAMLAQNPHLSYAILKMLVDLGAINIPTLQLILTGSANNLGQPVAQQQAQPALDKSMIQGLMNLTPDQLAGLSPQDRSRIMDLKNQLARGM